MATKSFVTCFVILHLLMQTASLKKYDTSRSHLDMEKDRQKSYENQSKYIIESSALPKNPKFYPTVANGYLGLRLFGDTMYVAGIYNGYHGDSHRARLPCKIPYIFNPTKNTSASVKFVQNMADGLFQVLKETKDNLTVQQTVYAHAKYVNILATEITVRTADTTSWKMLLVNMTGTLSNDIDFSQPSDVTFDKSTCPCSDQHQPYKDETCTQCKYLLTAEYIHGKTNIPEEDFSPKLQVHVMYSKYPEFLQGSLGTSTFLFLTVVGKTKEEAEYYYKKGLRRNQELFALHTKHWNKVWGSGKIDIDGSSFSNQVLTSSLYYLLSSFSTSKARNEKYKSEFYGVSPGGLSNGGQDQDYLGHVFWDQDFWMMPALLPFYPDLVKKVILYRVQRLPQARAKAEKYDFQGAMFPWESACTGNDVCPGEDYIKREIHITGDIIHLLKQYVYITQNWAIFGERVQPFKPTYNTHFGYKNAQVLFSCKATNSPLLTAWDMLRDVALFWESRVISTSHGSQYVINDIMGPDEWHSGVNNSAFTNAVARDNLLFAAEVAKRYGICPSLAKSWRHIGRRIVIPFDEAKRYHPEFDGFVPETGSVKQADAIMLSFPLQYRMPLDVHGNDLDVYRNATTDEGPAMTWSMFCINYLELNHTKEASEMYLRQLANVQQPFLIWSEDADGSGATNFLTGIGGYLQSVVYGYLGLRIKKDRLVVTPRRLPITSSGSVERMTFSEFQYHGFVMSITVDKTLEIRLTSKHWYSNPSLCLAVSEAKSPTQRYYLCSPGEFVITELTSCYLESQTVNK
uniref:Acid trehalase-like protein 1 n=1 Tax=Phallusia mammillata TaxID=59560 RepID=A0A6F9D6X0_9ASCI|nr:acid trehalase-like protein 1 [Phallusia mammillata]